MSMDYELVTVVFHKGEHDYRISMAVADLTQEEMAQLRHALYFAIVETERVWHDHGPPSKLRASAQIIPLESVRPSDTGRDGRASADLNRAPSALARFIEQATALDNLPMISLAEGLAMREGLPTPNEPKGKDEEG